MSTVHGSCLCGGVTYEVTGPLRDVVACHCTLCRKTSGHHVAATSCDDNDLKFVKLDTISWYRSSPEAERGFCNRCGSTMFWRRDGGHTTSIMAGTIDGPSGLKTSHHMHCATKGDYFEITDGLPQKDES